MDWLMGISTGDHRYVPIKPGVLCAFNFPLNQSIDKYWLVVWLPCFIFPLILGF